MRRLMLAAVALIAPLAACSRQGASDALATPVSDATLTPASDPGSAASGQSIFRLDTFGDETTTPSIAPIHLNNGGSRVSGANPPGTLSIASW